MKYAVNKAGIEAMNIMATAVTEALQQVEGYTLIVRSAADEDQETLGPHKASLGEALSDIAESIKQASEPATSVAEKLTEVAEAYEEIIGHDRIEGSSGGINSSGAAGGVMSAAAGGTAVGAAIHNAGERANYGNVDEMLSPEFTSGMRGILENSKHPDVKAVYKQYGDKLTVKDGNHNGSAFYRHGEGVYMNSGKVASGDIIHKPYQTAFHEFGHNIDYIMGNGMPISETWGNNALYDAIRQDFETLKGNQTNEQLVGSLKEQMTRNGWSIMDTASVSDIIERMTGISYPLGVGHGKDYWVGRLPNREFFAETLDGAAANERSYGLLQSMFPRAVSIVHRIIGGERK